MIINISPRDCLWHEFQDYFCTLISPFIWLYVDVRCNFVVCNATISVRQLVGCVLNALNERLMSYMGADFCAACYGTGAIDKDVQAFWSVDDVVYKFKCQCNSNHLFNLISITLINSLIV